MAQRFKAGTTETSSQHHNQDCKKVSRLLPDFPEGYAEISIGRNRSVSISILKSQSTPRPA